MINTSHVQWRAAEAGIQCDSDHPALRPDLLRLTGSLVGENTPPNPSSTLNVNRDMEQPYFGLHDKRVACVGAGAGAVILASYLSRRGAQPINITVFDPRGEYGGGWCTPAFQLGGFFNHTELAFDDSHVLTLENRSGHRMQEFLSSIAEDNLCQDTLVKGEVASIKPQKRDNAWLVQTAAGDFTEADIIILAPGTSIPRKIKGPLTASNLDELPISSQDGSFAVERYQRELTEEELTSGRPFIIQGLNLAPGMIHQIQQFEDTYGIGVDYKLLTDLTHSGIHNPDKSCDGKSPAFRNPERGYLSGFSGDIQENRNAYFRALEGDHIVSDVTGVHYDTEHKTLRIKSGDQTLEISKPYLFSLVGYEPDLALFKELGALSDGDSNMRLIRPSDGAVYVQDRGWLSNIYAIGACAASLQNRNAAVLPGILGQVPATSLTMGVRAMA